MTKARTKAQKRRKPGRTAKAGPRGATGRLKTQPASREREQAIIETVTTARLRQMGLKDTEANRADALAHEAGCVVGRWLISDAPADRADLWGAVKEIRRRVIAYDRAIGAPNRHAQCLRILTPTDTMHADAASPPLDDRTDEDKQRQAVSAWMALQGWLGHTDNAARTACLRAVVDEPDEPICDWPGVLLALRCVAEGMKGQKVTARVRR